MKKLATFFKLSLRRKYLLLFTFGLSVYSYLMMRFFNKYAQFKQSQNKKEAEEQLISDIRWAIRVVNKYVFWENVCRHQAYQAMILCRIYKIPYQIFIGFKFEIDGQNHKKMLGHAWATTHGEMLTGFCNPDEYVIQQVY